MTLGNTLQQNLRTFLVYKKKMDFKKLHIENKIKKQLKRKKGNWWLVTDKKLKLQIKRFIKMSRILKMFRKTTLNCNVYKLWEILHESYKKIAEWWNKFWCNFLFILITLLLFIYLFLKHRNNLINCGDYWHFFLICVWATINKWLIIGNLVSKY